jgi:hypothetical protein
MMIMKLIKIRLQNPIHIDHKIVIGFIWDFRKGDVPTILHHPMSIQKFCLAWLNLSQTT